MKSGPKELAAFHAAQIAKESKRMTAEKAALQELGLTEEQLAEKQAKVNALLHTQTGPGEHAAENSAKPAKKKRSDAGVPRKKVAEPQTVAGAITREQSARLLDLIESEDKRRVKWEADEAQAQESMALWHEAKNKRLEFISEITQK